ncbi:MAG: apolipoprotein N-acyltransferase [Hyphomonadaceae bacterium]
MTDMRVASGPPPHGRGNFLSPAYLWVAGLKGWRALLFCAVLGAVANFAFPPFFLWPIYAVSLCGLIWSLDAARLTAKPRRAAFWRVAAFAFTYYLVGLHWIAWAFLVNAEAYVIFIWMPLIALPGLLSAILAGMIFLVYPYWSAGPQRLLIFASAFMFAEWFRSSLFSIGGFPWNLPGMIWAPGEAISQSASLWGIYGLSVLTVVAMASPAVLTDSRPRGSATTRAAPLIGAAIVVGALWGEAPVVEATGPMVRLVEAGVPQNEKTRANAQKILDRFLVLTGEDTADAPGIVIWPEGALPAFLHEAIEIVPPSLRRRKLLIGIARGERLGSDDAKFYNSLAVLGGQSDMRGQLDVYDKHMLVPFGEFMPFAGVLKSIGLKTLQDLAPGGFDAGPSPSSVTVPGIPPFGPLICYEAIFPGLTAEGAERPAWLVNVTNDSWFGEFLGPGQHAAQARYRAIEEGLPLARVAAGGDTGMIDAYGRWTAHGKPADPKIYGSDPAGWHSSVVDARIPAALPATPYSNWRDGLFWLIFVALNLGLFVLPRR